MGRGLWFLAGAGTGVYGVLKARRAAEALTPEGLEDRVAALRHGAGVFLGEVRAGMTERETELRQRLVMGPHGGRRELTASESPREDHPHQHHPDQDRSTDHDGQR